MLSTTEQAALDVFRAYRVGCGKMLCFHTPQLAKHVATLDRLVERNLVVQEQFAGAYSMTAAGVRAMRRPG